MTEAYLLAVIVDRLRNPRALVVATTMLDGSQHRANARFRIG
jgi:hypothetical protein